MHLLYQTIVILLFRDYGSGSDQSLSLLDPKGICVHSADTGVSLLQSYHALYGLTSITNLAIHLTFTIAMTYVTDIVDNPGASEHSHVQLRQCLEFLQQIESTWPGAALPRKGIIAKLRQLGPGVISEDHQTWFLDPGLDYTNLEDLEKWPQYASGGLYDLQVTGYADTQDFSEFA